MSERTSEEGQGWSACLSRRWRMCCSREEGATEADATHLSHTCPPVILVLIVVVLDLPHSLPLPPTAIELLNHDKATLAKLLPGAKLNATDVVSAAAIMTTAAGLTSLYCVSWNSLVLGDSGADDVHSPTRQTQLTSILRFSLPRSPLRPLDPPTPLHVTTPHPPAGLAARYNPSVSYSNHQAALSLVILFRLHREETSRSIRVKEICMAFLALLLLGSCIA